MIVNPASIEVPERRARSVDTATVETLAESIKVFGLLNPLTISGNHDEGWTLVAGAHRLAAVLMLGWEEVEATSLGSTLSDVDLELVEIDENLVRSDLSKAERAQHLKRRKELWKKKQAEDDKVADVSATLPTGRGNTGFASETAVATGLSKGTINQEIAKAEKIDDDVLAEAAEHKLSGRALDRIAKAEDQRSAVKEEIDFKSERRAPSVSKEDSARAAFLRALATAIEVLGSEEVERLYKENT